MSSYMSLIYVATIIPLSVCVSVDLSKCAACTAYDVPCFFPGHCSQQLTFESKAINLAENNLHLATNTPLGIATMWNFDNIDNVIQPHDTVCIRRMHPSSFGSGSVLGSYPKLWPQIKHTTHLSTHTSMRTISYEHRDSSEKDICVSLVHELNR